MYHHILRIVVFTKDSFLENEIRAIAPKERFSHEVKVLKEFLPSMMATADIAILDVPAPMSFKEMRMRAKPNARLVVCLSAAAEEGMSEEDIASVDDVWVLPLRGPRIRLRMGHILYGIKRDDDARQHLIWLNTLIDSMPDLVWFKDLDGIHHKVNSKFCEFVRKSRDMVEGATHSTIWDIPEEESARGDYSCNQSENAAISSGSTFLTDEIVKSGNEKHLFKTYKTPLKGLNGEILGTVGFAHDMTSLLNLDMELNYFIESMPFPLVLSNPDHTVNQVNSHFLEFFREKRENIIGEIFHNWEARTLHVEKSAASGQEFLCFTPEPGKTLSIHMTRKDIHDIFGKKVGYIKIFRDVTAEKELENRIWKDANTDALTGLSNRHAFGNFVKNLPPDSPVQLVYIDLDEFKAVNDTWGHKIGDEVIRMVGGAIREVFPDDFPARLGGDEFLICITREIPLEDVVALADQFLKDIQKKFGDSVHFKKMSASIGIRGNGHASDSMDALIKEADEAMYMAKTKGKSQYCVWRKDMRRVA